MESIAWLETPKHAQDLTIRQALSMSVRGRRAHWIRVGIIAPISLAGIMLYRGSGLRDLMRGLMVQAVETEGLAAAAVVQFSDAAKVSLLLVLVLALHFYSLIGNDTVTTVVYQNKIHHVRCNY